MKEYRMRKYSYTCSCGFTAAVFLDAGVPGENIPCRRCGRMIKRVEI